LNSNLKYLVVLPSSLFCLENCVFLFRGVQLAGAAWHAVMMIVAGVENLVQRTADGRTGWIFGGWAIERSSSTVYGLHRARGDDEREFLG
jgi:hypothetical protein